MSSTYRHISLALPNFYKHMSSNNNSCVSANLGSVGVREVGISFPLLSALLTGLLLQHMLHTSVCFVSYNCSDPSVLVAGKSCSQTEILANTCAHLEKTKKTASVEQWNLSFTVVILHRAGNIHYHCFSWNSQLTFIGLTLTCPLTTPTKSHPHKFNYVIFSLQCRQHSQNSQK